MESFSQRRAEPLCMCAKTPYTLSLVYTRGNNTKGKRTEEKKSAVASADIVISSPMHSTPRVSSGLFGDHNMYYLSEGLCLKYT